MRRIILCAFLVLLAAAAFSGCMMQGNIMSESEKLFIKMINKATKDLDLNESQKVQLEQLKVDIQKNFVEGEKEKVETTAEINKEQIKENPDNQKLSLLMKSLLRNETERVNRAFEMTLNLQKNLNDDQKKKYNQVIAKWAED